MHLIVVIISVAVLTAGCATQATHFRLDTSLQKDIAMLSGAEYISLAKLCDFYGIEYKYDTFTGRADVRKGPNIVVIRTGGSGVLVNGEFVKSDNPVIMRDGVLFVPMALVKNNMGPVMGRPAVAILPKEEAGPKRFFIKSIVIDAGHGGKDPGALGRRSRLREKDMTLRAARKLKSLLEDAGIRVIMTRDSDVFIPLETRSSIANRSGADLFVSVHINSSRARSMRGFECYYLANTTDDNARALEAMENSSLRLDSAALVEHSRRLDKALWDLTLTENRIESAELAGSICDSIDSGLTMGNRGVRTARFYVLKFTHIPAVLVEAGYLSNKYEELKLKDPDFLDRVAESVAQGILRYKREYERTQGFTRI
ncbi:MAG: N-acetylmuramoyl-L-alanine amidase [Candidatus Omnitrophica bacterium]|nr:N-acetylmuramoyl-L-alanine amidase [Candidatus Omnitrophota bacterium]